MVEHEKFYSIESFKNRGAELVKSLNQFPIVPEYRKPALTETSQPKFCQVQGASVFATPEDLL